MNWAKELIELSEQHGGDMLHPEVVKYGHYLWQKADESRFLVDRNRKFNDITKLCSFLHISNNDFITRANNGDELNLSKLKINGHIVEINKKSGRSGFVS